jgi:hypothetical protein
MRCGLSLRRMQDCIRRKAKARRHDEALAAGAGAARGRRRGVGRTEVETRRKRVARYFEGIRLVPLSRFLSLPVSPNLEPNRSMATPRKTVPLAAPHDPTTPSKRNSFAEPQVTRRAFFAAVVVEGSERDAIPQGPRAIDVSAEVWLSYIMSQMYRNSLYLLERASQKMQQTPR